MEAQQATKIRQSFLAALEEDDYSILPPPVYVRGFIKTYSNYLGLDSEEMVMLFDELLESVAAGYEPSYQSYGSTDSGGALPPPAINPQMLAGLSQSEARMVERSSELINLSPHAEAETPTEKTEESRELTVRRRVGLGSADSSGMNYAARRFSGLRVPEKYVLKPAIQPINKPSFYIPNFVPLILVLIIVGAAFLIVYRSVVVPPVKDNSDMPTVTANVYSRPTVTPLPTDEVGNAVKVPGQQAQTTPGVSSKVPAYYTPEQALLTRGPSPSANATNAANLPPALTQPTPTVTPAAATVKVEISAAGGQSWLSVIIDGQEKYGKILASGDTFVAEGKTVAVRAGAPAYIKVKVNGQDKEYSPPASGIITHTWTASGDDKITN